MATGSAALWQLVRPWVSAGRIVMVIALSPLLICGALLGAVASLVSPLFPARPSSAGDMVEGLTEILMADDESFDMDDAINNVVGRTYSDPRIEQLKQRLKQLPDLPWSRATIEEVAGMRDMARAIAGEGIHDDR